MISFWVAPPKSSLRRGDLVMDVDGHFGIILDSSTNLVLLGNGLKVVDPNLKKVASPSGVSQNFFELMSTQEQYNRGFGFLRSVEADDG